MKKIKALTILLAVLLLSVGLLRLPVLADAGNFAGSSNYGGGSSYSGGGSFGGGSSFIVLGGDSGSGGNGAAVIVAAVVIILIVARIVRQSQFNAVSSAGSRTPEPEEQAGGLAPIATLRESDPNFSEQALREKLSNLYVQMQDAWQKKDFEPMRPYMTDALYTQFDRQLDELRGNGQTNHIDRIAVLGVSFSGWRSDDANESIVALVSARIVDYTTDDKTDKLVSGSRSVEKFMTYQWTLVRSKGKKTAAPGEAQTDAKHCPNCGAPLDVNESARCPYCGSVVTARDFDWAISAIRGISQRNG